jgi:hypothetical protein
MALTTEIGLVKTEIASSLAASLYTAKDLVYVAKAIEALANAEAASGIFETLDINSNLYVGPLADTFESAASLTNPVIIAQVSANDYAQVAFKNTNAGTNASTDFIAYSNNGTDTAGYIDMGITSSTFSDPEFTITGAGDGYIFVTGAEGGSDRGNLVLATGNTGSQNKIIFAAGGLASDNEQMTIIPDQRVHIEIPTASTSPSTGALTVVGGVGIQGDVNIQGAITFGGAGTSVSAANLSVTDPLLFVGNANSGDALDLGFIGEYTSPTSTLTRTVSNKALTSNIATITTSATHGFAVGDYVVVSGVDATFNGTYLVASVPTTTTFTYAKTATNVTSAAATGSAVVSSKRRFGGIVRDASDGIIKVFEDATTKPSSVVNFAESGLIYGDFQVGTFAASSAVIGNVSNTELQYLDGVTSAIQTQLNTKAVYPDQTSNSGKYLTTNGTATSWATVDALPAQANNSGYYLTTNGTAASWQPIVTDPMPQIFMMMGA